MKLKLKNKGNEIQLLLMILISISSQMFALYKSSYTAMHFGATNVMDAYNYALNIASFLFAFVTTGVTTVIIPAYVKKKNPRAINTFITIIYGCIMVVMIAVYLFRYPLISLLTNRDIQFQQYFADFLVYAFIIQCIISFLAVTTAYYQCINRYVIPKFIVLVTNLLVFFVLVIIRELTIEQYIEVLVLGSVINFIIDVAIAFKLGFRYTPKFLFKNTETKSLFLIFLPTLFSSGVYKIHTLVDTMIAANLGTGQLTILTYATQIVNMVNTFVVSNLTVYAYPKIVARIQEKDGKRKLWDYAILFHAIICLIICGFIAVGDYGINLIFVRGSFGSSEGRILYLCSCVYILGQQTNIIRDLVYRYFYANDDTKTTFFNSVIVSLLNIVLSIILVIPFGVYGVVIGTILSSAFSFVMILFRFNRTFVLGQEFKMAVIEYGKTITASMITIIVILIVKFISPLSNDIICFIAYGCITVTIYFILLLIMKNKALKVRI